MMRDERGRAWEVNGLNGEELEATRSHESPATKGVRGFHNPFGEGTAEHASPHLPLKVAAGS
jgi:hypothetical protein